MSLDGARLHYVDKEGAVVVVPAKGRSFQVGAYLSCDLLLGGEQGERLICEIMRDAFGRVYLYNKSISETILLDDKAILQGKKRPLLHGGRIKIFDQDYTWEFPKSDDAEDVPSTPERLSPAEQGSNSCPSLKSHRAQIDKRLTVHNFHYSINSDDEGNTSIESRDQDESLAEAENDLNLTAPPSLDLITCETPKVDLVEATQNKENTTSTPASHQKLLMLCARSDVVITSFSPRETGVKIEKSFTCVRKPAVPTIATVSTPKSVYSTPKGVLSEPNDDSCSRDLMDFSTPSTSKKGKRESSMFLIDLTTPSKLRPTINAKQLPTPISVDSTDESSDGSPMVIDITNSATPSSPAVSQLKQQSQTPRRLVGAPATPKRTPQSLMKRALLTSTKKQIASNCAEAKGSPTATPTSKRTSLLEARRQCLTTPRRLPFHPHRQTPVHRSGSNEDRNKPPKTSPRKKLPQNLGTPRENKLSQLRKSLALSKRSPGVDKSNMLVAKACRSLNSPKSGSPKPASPKPESPVNRLTYNVSEKCSTPEHNDDSTSELSRTFTILDESQDGDKSKATSVVETVAALVTGEVSFQIEDSVKALEKSLPLHLKSNETKMGSVATDLELEEKDIEPKEDTKPSVSVDATKEDPIDVIPDVEPQPSKAVEDQSAGDIENPEEDPETAPIIEESICEEVQADIPEKSLDEADKTFEVVEDIICEEVQTEVKPNDEEEAASPIKHKETSSVQPQTPVTRRSSRRLSVDQRAAVTTPRRSSRRASMEAAKKAETDTTKKLKRRASYSAVERHEATTPRRKRRVSEDVSTPTRQSKRLLNTPKKTLAVDESVGDMGVIVEETSHDHGEKSIIADDEDYGNELPGDEVDKVDYHGLRDLLKTPKSCSTPRFKGLREMMRTPKVPASPILDNIEEMLESSAGSTPHHKSSSVSAAHVTIDGGKLLDRVLKTPSARNIMVPNDPASAVLKSRTDSVAPTTEYNLSMGNATLHLDKIFDDVGETANDTEVEINVTTVSTVADPLEKSTKNDSISSEALMSVCSTATLSALKDPLTSTTYKGALQADQHLGAKNEHRPASPEDGEMSGIQLLDQTSESMFSEPLIVSGVDSCDITVEETKADVPIKLAEEHSEDRSDTDSTVGLTEPLFLSDDDEEGSGTPKKSKDKSAAEKLDENVKGESIADTLEESVDQEAPAKDTPSNDDVASISKASEKLGESQIEISLIEADESAAETDKSLVIELDDSSDTETPPKGTNESASVDLTILDGETSELAEESKSVFENETYYLDSTAECRSVNQSRKVDSIIDISKATDVNADETSEDVSNYISPEVESEPEVEPTESIAELIPATDDVAVQEVPDVSTEINSSDPEKADPPVSDNNSEVVSIASVSEQSRDDNRDVSFELPAEDASVAEESITPDTNKEAEETAPITIKEIPPMDKKILSDAAITDGKEEVAEDDGPKDNEESPLTLANPAESEGKAQQTKENEAVDESSDLTVEDNDIFEESSVTDKSVKEAVKSENSAAKTDIPSLDKPVYQNLSDEIDKAEKSDEKTEDVETEIQSKDESRIQEETTTSVAETLSNTTSEITSAEVELSSNNDSDVCFVEESLSQNQADETSEDIDNFDEKSEVKEKMAASILESTNAASVTENDVSIPSLDRSLLQNPEDTTPCDVKDSDEKTEGGDEASSSQVASSSDNEIEALPPAEPSSQADKTLGNAEDSILDTETDTQGVVDVSTSNAKTSADVLEKGLEESMLGETPESDNVQVNSILETESVEDTAPHNLSIAELTRLDAFASLEEEMDEVIQLDEEDSDGAPAEEVISAEEIEVPISEESTSKDTIQDADAIEEAKNICLADDSTTKPNQELNEETALENATEEVQEINPPEKLDAPSTKIISQPCNDIAAKPEILKDAGPKSSKPTQVKAVTDEAIVDTESLRRLDMELDQLEDTALDQPGFDIDDDLEILNDKPIQVSGKEVSEKQEETSEIETASSNTLKELDSNQPEELDVPSTESIADQPDIPSESLNNVDSETTKPTQVCDEDVAEENEVTFETDTCPEDVVKEMEFKKPEEHDASSTKLDEPCNEIITDDTEVSDEDKEKEATLAGEDTQEVTIAAEPSNPPNQTEDVISIEAQDQPSITEATEVLDNVDKEPEVTEEQEVTFETETCPSNKPNQPEDTPSESIRDQPTIDDSESVKNPEVRDEEVTEQQEVTIPTETSPSNADHEVQAADVVEDLAKPSNDHSASPENSFQTETENQNDSILIEDDSLPAKETQETLKLSENPLEGMEEGAASTKEPIPVIEIEDSSSSEQEFGKSAIDADKPEETLIIDEEKSSSKQSESNIPDADIPPTTDDTKVMTSNDLPEDDKISQESKSALDAVMEEAQEEPPQSLDDQSKMDTGLDQPVKPLDIEPSKEATDTTEANDVTIISDDESEGSPKEEGIQIPAKEEAAATNLTIIETPEEPTPEPEAASLPIPKPSVDEDIPKEEKAVKRTTRKGSAHADPPNEAIDLGRTKRRGRKPSAEVVEEATDQKPEESSKRRLRKPSKDVEESKQEHVAKSPKGKPKLRGRTPSSEVVEEVAQDHKEAEDLPPIVEEALESPAPNEQSEEHAPTRIEKVNNSEKSVEVIHSEDTTLNSEESLKTNAEEVAPKKDAGAEHKDHEEPKKRRGRKPSADVASSSSKELAKEVATDDSEPHKAEQELPSIPESESSEAKPTETPESHDLTEKPKRRGRKPSNNVVHADVEKPKRRAKTPADTDDSPEKKTRRIHRKASAETVESNVLPEKEPLQKIDEQEVLDPISEEKPSTEAKVEDESGKATEPQPEPSHLLEKEEPKTRRRGRKPTAESAEIPSSLVKSPEPLAEKEEYKIRRRGRKASAETVELATKEDLIKAGPKTETVHETPKPLAEEAEHKPRRRGRKLSVEAENVSTLKDLVYSGAEEKSATPPKTEPEPLVPVPEVEEEPKTRRRGRKPTAETVEIPAKKEATPEAAPVAVSRRRGRKATEDEDHSTMESKPKRRARKASVEEVKDDLPVPPQVDLPSVVEVAPEVVEKKPARRARKASSNVDEATPAKKAPARRARKADASHDDELEKQINLHDLPTENVDAVIVTSASVETVQDPASSGEAAEEEMTPRRREGRNLPRKNYDETSDEDKPSSSHRRARKPAVNKAPVAEAPTMTPQKIVPPVEEVATPVNTMPPPEPTTSQRREGRNLPRKNYAEAPDEDKRSASRSRRVRQPTVKALELIVSNSPRPDTPKKRKGKAAAGEEPQEKKVAQEAPAPQAAVEPAPAVTAPKARGGRRKAEEIPVEPELEAKPAKKNARAPARKAKAPVEAPAEDHPPAKKSRVASRAKTPVAAPEEATPEPEVPAKKPAARSRARGGAKAAKAAAVVEDPHPPAQESETEAPSSTAARGGRARKVHFEASITPAEAAGNEAAAPKRATRSRRK